MQLVLVSGLSGSGKSIALHVLEDGGYYCVDNLPATLLMEVIDFLSAAGHDRVAVSIDGRSAALPTLPEHIAELRRRGADCRVLYLEANSQTLLRRFSETRRRHPFSSEVLTLTEAIEFERELLADVRDVGFVFDTSDLSAAALRAWIKDFAAVDASRLTVQFESFGFKHGVPLDADLVFDVRCLPNPHYEAELQPLTGRDAAVVGFLEKARDVERMYQDIEQFVERWLPNYARDNRNYLTVAIGCTGGRHRSVYFVERLARAFESRYQVLKRHREIGLG